MYWKLPYSYNIGQNLPKKPISQKWYLERSKWAVLLNLSLIYIMIMIHEKKLPIYVLEFALQLQHWSKFAQKISIKVLRKVQMSCALELKPHSNIDDDLWKKIWMSGYPKSQNKNYT